MNTKELYKRKLKLSSDITIAVAKLYREFAHETGECPEYIGINLVDTTAIGDTKPSKAVSNTDVDIRI